MIEEVSMKKIKRYTAPALMVSLLIPSVGGTMAPVSCTLEPQKDFPAYYFNIQLPAEEPLSSLTIERGSSLTLPVTVTSNSDVPVSIRLTQDNQRILPDSITFETPPDYAALQPGENATLYVTFNVSELATPGEYSTGIHGQLKEPVANRCLMTQLFTLIVTDRQSEGE